MGVIKLTADSTCDLSDALIKKLDLDIIRLYVSLGEKIYRDGYDINPDIIFDFVSKQKILPKTAAPSPKDYIKMFSKYSKTSDAIIHFNISSEMSASNQNACIAAQNFENVYIIDSLSLSTGTSLLILKADELIKEGKAAKEIVAALEDLKAKVQASFVVDTLEYLHKGGRCSGLARLGATVFKIHPMLLVKNGNITVYKKLRGKISLVYMNYIETLRKNYPDPELKNVFLTHSGCSKETLAAIKKKVSELYKFENIFETVAGCTITSHCGKGTLGLIFINSKSIT